MGIFQNIGYCIKCKEMHDIDLSCVVANKLDLIFPMPSGQQQLNGAVKADESKRRIDLVPSSIINGLAKALGFGAEKYGEHNWRLGLKWSRAYAALQRHLADFWDGEDLDPESSLPHLYHAACNLAFLIEYFENYKHLDDRFKKLPF